MATASPATAVRVRTTLSDEATPQECDDEFYDIIHGGYFGDDDGRPHDEGCEFYIGECDELARFWVLTSRSDEKRYYCPKHFALLLHDIIDALSCAESFADVNEIAPRREVVHTFIIEWGRTGR